MKMTSVLSLTGICCFTIVPTHKQEPMNNIVICTYTLQHCNLHIYFLEHDMQNNNIQVQFFCSLMGIEDAYNMPNVQSNKTITKVCIF
jgi:hypothetical protein